MVFVCTGEGAAARIVLQGGASGGGARAWEGCRRNFYSCDLRIQPVKFLMSVSVPVALPKEHLQHLLVAALVGLEQQLAHPGCVSL